MAKGNDDTPIQVLKATQRLRRQPRTKHKKPYGLIVVYDHWRRDGREIKYTQWYATERARAEAEKAYSKNSLSALRIPKRFEYLER